MGDLPPPLARKWGHLRFIRQVTRTEWHSECPVCRDHGHRPGTGDPDRFHMHYGDDSGPRGACRRCGFFEWADEDTDVTDEEIEEWRKVAVETREEQERKIAAKIDDLQENRWYERFTEMTEEQRHLWRKEGVPDSLQRYMRLGYMDRKGYNFEGELYYSPALVIPYFGPGWIPQTIQYRLLDPVKNAGKYRGTSGITTPLYLTDPDRALDDQNVLVTEGAKKALVTYLELVLKGDVRDYVVVGLPSKQVGKDHAEQLSVARRVYLLLDPDAGATAMDETELAAAARTIGAGRTYTLSLPDKVDDLINAGHLTGEHLVWLLKQARKV